MLRAFAIFAAFAVVSPVVRGWILEAYQAFDQLVQGHATTAYVITGVLGSASFLFLRFTAKD